MSEDKAVELGYVIDPAFQGRGKILLYGHTHESKEDKFYQSCLRQMQENDCRHAYDACDGKIRACNV